VKGACATISSRKAPSQATAGSATAASGAARGAHASRTKREVSIGDSFDCSIMCHLCCLVARCLSRYPRGSYEDYSFLLFVLINILAYSLGKNPGPDGPSTLCGGCGGRYRSGATGPLKQNTESGKFMCEACGREFDTAASVGGHMRFCDGGHWRCAWCECKADECSGKNPGPDGAATLCGACGARYRTGAVGPPPRDEQGRFLCTCGEGSCAFIFIIFACRGGKMMDVLMKTRSICILFFILFF